MQIIIVLALMFCLSGSETFSQQELAIEDLDSKAKKEWQLIFDLKSNLARYYDYALLKNGVAVYSKVSQTLYCLDFNGRKLWEHATSHAYLMGSPDGMYLYTYRPTGENLGISAIWTSSGNMLWESDKAEVSYKISPSSNYLFTHFSRLEPRTFKVLDLKSGRKLWELEIASYWQVAAANNGRIAYYTHKSLRLFDLESGELIWEKPIQADVQENLESSKLHFSKNGQAIVLQAKYTPDDGIHTYVFDGNGQIRWERVRKLIPGKTSGGVVEAISNDGKFIVMYDNQQFLLFSSESPDPIWTLKERITPPYIQEFTNGVLAFRTNSNNKTRVIVLNRDGTLKQDYLFSQKIEFNTPWPEKVLVIEPKGERVGLSLFDLKLNSSN